MNNLSQAIRNDIEIFGNDGTYWSPDDIAHGVNYWKRAIYETFDGKTVGKTIWISSSSVSVIVCCMKAIWELGGSVFNQQFPQGADDVPVFKDFYNFIDLKIVHNDFGFKDNHKFLYIKDYDRNSLCPTVEYELDDVVTDQTIAVKTHTSGTTGFPKLLNYTHRNAIDGIPIVIKMHGWTEEDIPVHYKSLHHGALFLRYAIPLFALCKTHHSVEGMYAATEDAADDPLVFFNKVLPYAKEVSATVMMCPYDWVNELPNADAIDLERKLTVLATPGVRVKETLCDIFANFNIKEFGTCFGTVELGRMFLERTTPENLDSFEVGKFTIINTDIEYEFHENFTMAKVTRIGTWIKIADIFEQRDGHVYFMGRNQSFIINGKTVRLSDISDALTKQYNASFSVVPDLELNCMYLACFDDNIPTDLTTVNNLITEKLSSEYNVTKVARMDVSQIRRGIKPSTPLLLYYFRNI